MPETKVDEGQPAGGTGSTHPETVPWGEYVGVKESLGKKLDIATQKVASLEEQMKTVIKPEDHERLKKELDDSKASHKLVSDELTGIKEKSNTEKRSFLISKGVPEEKVKAMSVEALGVAMDVLDGMQVGGSKPRPDLGGGGGASVPKGSPMELARQAYSKSNK